MHVIMVVLISTVGIMFSSFITLIRTSCSQYIHYKWHKYIEIFMQAAVLVGRTEGAK